MSSSQSAKPAISTMSANTAILNRFHELPRSKREALKAKLEDVDQWHHFERFVIKPGHDLGKINLRCAIVIKPALFLTDEMLINNKVDFSTYENFSKPV